MKANLSNRVTTWIRPPYFPEDPDKNARARTLYVFLLSVFGGIVLLLASLVVFDDTMDPVELVIAVGLALFSIGMLALLRRGYIESVGIVVVSVLWLGFSFLILRDGGIRDVAVTGYFLVVVIASFVLGSFAALGVAGLSVVSMGVAYALERSGWLDMSRLLPSSVIDLLMLIVIFAASAGVLNSAIRRMAEASALTRRQSEELQVTNLELADSRDALAEQTARLQRRTAHLDASIEVARAALASVGDVQQLLSSVVEVISEQFGYYHVGIFWVDPSGEWVALQSASSSGGRRMVSRAHRLPLGKGIVGYVAQTGEARIALDVGDDAVFFDNPDLPETRSEMAVPLEIQDRVIGVLDVQSTAPAAFNEDDISVLRSVADQISLALANARLLEEAQQSVRAMQRAYGEMTEEAWRELLRSVPDLGFVSGIGGTLPLADETPTQLSTVQDEVVEVEPGTMAVPVKAGGQVLGCVEVHLPPEKGTWTPERVEMLETLSDQLSQALERARLYRETQRAAAQQRAIAEVGTRIRESLDMEAMLRTAAREMRSALGLQDLVVRLASSDRSVRQDSEGARP